MGTDHPGAYAVSFAQFAENLKKEHMKRKVLVEKNILAIAVMLVGIALIAYGISRGQVTSVLNKAIRVCMECIGIG